MADLIHKVVKELKKNLGEDWTSDHRKNIYSKVRIAIKHVLMREGIKGQQLVFITKAIMEQAETSLKIGHMRHNVCGHDYCLYKDNSRGRKHYGSLNPPGSYGDFVRYIIELGESSIITFNYDVSMDYALQFNSMQYDYCLTEPRSGSPKLVIP